MPIFTVIAASRPVNKKMLIQALL